MNYKEEIAKQLKDIFTKLNIDISDEELINTVEEPKEKSNGDFSFPCFKMSKILKKSPVDIANNIKDEIDIQNSIFEKIDVVNGFLNFYIDKNLIVKQAIEKFNNQKEEYGKQNIGEGKTILIEYSSPNIAKPFHIGHLKNTIIGHSLYNIYKYLGFNTISINHLGDYGTQFAKLIEGYKRWGNEYDFSTDSMDKLADIYKRINELCEEDENVLNECRETFKKFEDKDPYCIELWNKFKDMSLKEFEKIYDLLGVKFDVVKGESFYADMKEEVLDLLEKSGRVEESQGAKIIDLTNEGIDTPCIIEKSNGASIYATRDLGAILYRSRTFDYDKCIYVVGNEQSLYLKQIFAVSKLLGIDKKYTDSLEHVSYGMIRLPEGKMSTRKGNFVKVDDLLNEAVTKVQEIMKDRDIENKEEISKQIGIGAVVFDDLKESRNKDQVFNLNDALNFNGETGPYIQYTIARINSILEKTKLEENINYEKLTDEYSLDVIKLISKFSDMLVSSSQKNEPSILARYLLDLSESFSTFYNNNKVICDDLELQNARLYLSYITKVTLTNGLKLLGIESPNKM